jgi:hypothetical protein
VLRNQNSGCGAIFSRAGAERFCEGAERHLIDIIDIWNDISGGGGGAVFGAERHFFDTARHFGGGGAIFLGRGATRSYIGHPEQHLSLSRQSLEESICFFEKLMRIVFVWRGRGLSRGWRSVLVLSIKGSEYI